MSVQWGAKEEIWLPSGLNDAHDGQVGLGAFWVPNLASFYNSTLLNSVVKFPIGQPLSSYQYMMLNHKAAPNQDGIYSILPITSRNEVWGTGAGGLHKIYPDLSGYESFAVPGGAQATWDGEYIWTSGNSIYRTSPDNPTAYQTVTGIPSTWYRDVVYDSISDAVWAVAWGYAYKIDRHTLQLLQTVNFNSGYPQVENYCAWFDPVSGCIFAGGEYSSGSPNYIVQFSVTNPVPIHYDIQAIFGIPSLHWAHAMYNGAGLVFVALHDQPGHIITIDPNLGPVDIWTTSLNCHGVAYDGQNVWAADNREPSVISRRPLLGYTGGYKLTVNSTPSGVTFTIPEI